MTEKTFHISEIIWFGDRHICPDCADHEQGDIDKYYDCKNVFFEYGPDGEIRIVGQCMCYGPAHGKREKEDYSRYFPKGDNDEA